MLATTEVDDGGSTNVFGGDDVVRSVRARVGNANYVSDGGRVVRRMRTRSTGSRRSPSPRSSAPTGR